MSKTTNVSIRIDEELKQKSETIFSELGLTMSTALTLFLRSAIRYGGIPFELRIEKPNATTINAIDDVNHNCNISRTFDSIESLIEDLDA
ncbi:MAG: type II toxin-antitoxin system RelB/DinJ family antitoxin [Bacteroidales bacterium]|jgi:DNA-damage-inducible protein J